MLPTFWSSMLSLSLLKKHLSPKSRISMTTGMWCKPKLVSDIAIYLLSSVLMVTDCYWRSQSGDRVSALITSDTAVKFLTKGYCLPKAQSSFLQVGCYWFLPQLVWSYPYRSEGSQDKVRIMLIRGINGQVICGWVVWLPPAGEFKGLTDEYFNCKYWFVFTLHKFVLLIQISGNQ